MGVLGIGAGILGVLLVHASAQMHTVVLDGRVGSLLRFTLLQALLSTLLSLVTGVLLAWALHHTPRFRGRGILIALWSASLVLPTLIVAFGIITILGNHGWLNRLLIALGGTPVGHGIYGLGGILIGHVYLNGAFAGMGLLRAFGSIPDEKLRLARSLGLSPWQRFVLVEWPAIRGTLPAMGSTIFMLCFSSFALVLLLGGNPAYNTLEVAIYEAVRIDFDLPYALALAWIQLGVAAGWTLLASRLPSPPANLTHTAHSTMLWRDRRAWRWLQNGLVVLFAIAYLLPLSAIIVDGLGADLGGLMRRPLFWRSVGMSLGIATLSALLALGIALALADAQRHLMPDGSRGHGVWSSVGRLMVSGAGHLYLAIPSLILGLGFFLLGRRIGVQGTAWSLMAVTTANVLMALPFALSILSPTLHKTARRYERLVRALGIGYFQRWRNIEWPYLRAQAGYVFALAFGLSLGDLGVIALFGNREITTLPWYLYQLMGSYRTNDAAGVALLLLVWVTATFGAAYLLAARHNDVAR